MAKKDSFDLEDDGFGDFDNMDTWDDAGFDFKPEKDDRSPSAKIVGSFKDGLVNHFKDPNTQKNLLKKALPPGYDKAIEVVDSGITEAKTLYDNAAKEIKPKLKELGRIVTKSSTGSSILPKSLSDRLSDWLKDEETYKEESQKERQEKEISISLGEIFKEQAADTEQQRKLDFNERRIKDQIDAKRFKSDTDILTAIRGGIERQVGFQDNVTYAYQKKSLELQYRQYFTTAKLLEVSQKHFGFSEAAYEKIVKNTYLPDFAKIHLNESAKEMLRNKTLGAIGNFVGDSFGGIKERALGNLKSKVNDFKESISMGLDMAQMLAEATQTAGEFGQSKSEMAADVAGGMTGDWLTDLIANKMAPIFAKNPKLVAMGKTLGRTVDNGPELLNRFSKMENRKTGFLGGLIDFAQEIVTPYRRDDLVRSQNTDLDAAAVFNYRSQVALTEVIPGWLAKINREITSLRTGTDAPLERYDYRSGVFVTTKDIGNKLISKIFNKQSIEESKSAVGDYINELDSEKKLSIAARRALEQNALKMMSKGELDINSLQDIRSYKGVAPDVAEELSSFFKSNYGLKDKSAKGMFGSATDIERQSKLSKIDDRYQKLKKVTPNIKELLIKEVEQGNLDLLQQLGLVEIDDQGNAIQQYDDIIDRYTGGGDRDRKPNRPRPLSGVKSRLPIIRGVLPFTSNRDIDTQRVASARSTNNVKATLDAKPIEEAIEKLNESLTNAINGCCSKTEIGESRLILQAILETILTKNFGTNEISGDGATGGNTSTAGLIGELLKRGTKKGAQLGGSLLSNLNTWRKFVNRRIADVVTTGFKVGKSLGGFGLEKLKQIRDRAEDIYVANKDKPVILYRDLKAGRYRDSVTGKVITTVKDIKNAVIDELGNIVITQEEIDQGLYSKRGYPLLKRIGTSILGAAKWWTGKVDNFFRFTREIMERVYKHVDVYSDVYVVGENKPRMLAALIRNGYYYARDLKKPVFKYGDIGGTIVDKDGNEVLRQEDIDKGLVDKEGKPLKGIGDRLYGLGSRGLGLGSKLLDKGIELSVRWAKFTHRTLKGALKTVSKFFGAGDDSSAFITLFSSGHQETVDELRLIRGLLEARLPGGDYAQAKEWTRGTVKSKKKSSPFDTDGDGDREGSWQDQREAKAKKAGLFAGLKDRFAKKDDNTEKKPKSGLLGLLGGLLGMGSGLIGGGFKLLFKSLSWLPTIGKGVWTIASGVGKLAKLLWPIAKFLGSGAFKAIGSLLSPKGLVGKGLGLAVRAIPAAASLGMGALGMAGTALGAVAGAAGAILTSPVTIPLALTAGGAYLGYKLYKSIKGKTTAENAVIKARMVGYGVDPGNEEKVKQILALESKVATITTFSDGTAKLKNGLSINELVDVFGIDSKNQKQLQSFMAWFAERFKPIYLTFCTALYNRKKSMDLNKVNELLTNTEKAEYIKETTFNMDDKSPYVVGASPFPDDGLDFEARQVRDKLKSIHDEMATIAVNSPGGKKKTKTDKDGKPVKETTEEKSYYQSLKDMGQATGDKFKQAWASYKSTSKSFFDKIATGVEAVKQGVKSGYEAYEQGGLLGGVSTGVQTTYKVLKGDAKKNRAALIAEMIAQGITDPKEQAMLLAQVDHESGGFTSLEENLKYRPEVLMKISATARKKGIDAVQSAVTQGPQAVANMMYGGRMGNTDPNDGWQYRGRGLIQLTGKDNYMAAGKALGIDLLNNPDLAARPDIAAKIAVWFWKTRVGGAAQSGDVVAVTKKINGGTIGLEDRTKKYQMYLAQAQSGKLIEDSGPATPTTPGKATTAVASKDGKAKPVVAANKPAANYGVPKATQTIKPPAMLPGTAAPVMASYTPETQRDEVVVRNAIVKENQTAMVDTHRTTSAELTATASKSMVDLMSRSLDTQNNMEVHLKEIRGTLAKIAAQSKPSSVVAPTPPSTNSGNNGYTTIPKASRSPIIGMGVREM